jgi:hypothetical protein
MLYFFCISYISSPLKVIILLSYFFILLSYFFSFTYYLISFTYLLYSRGRFLDDSCVNPRLRKGLLLGFFLLMVFLFFFLVIFVYLFLSYYSREDYRGLTVLTFMEKRLSVYYLYTLFTVVFLLEDYSQ